MTWSLGVLMLLATTTNYVLRLQKVTFQCEMQLSVAWFLLHRHIGGNWHYSLMAGLLRTSESTEYHLALEARAL